MLLTGTIPSEMSSLATFPALPFSVLGLIHFSRGYPCESDLQLSYYFHQLLHGLHESGQHLFSRVRDNFLSILFYLFYASAGSPLTTRSDL